MNEALRRDLAARGRIGGYALRSRHDPLEYTANGRAAFLRRFWPSDPDLSEEEASRRAQAALKAHMLRLARLSALKRRRKAGSR